MRSDVEPAAEPARVTPSDPPSDPPAEAMDGAAWTVCRAVTRLASRSRAERGGLLSLNQTAVLGRLSTHSAMTPGEVASQLRTQPQSLTRTFAALEQDGLVLRTIDPQDHRQALLDLTDRGRSALRAEMAPRAEFFSRAISSELTDVERELLVLAARLMERLADHGPDVVPPGS